MHLHTLAPAKVNLVLRVGPARADGYHDLLTLMVPLDLADEVDVRVGSRRGPITCRVPGWPALEGDANLAAKAAHLFRERFGVDRSVGIRIAKRIPVVAGLGGGSSDAAAVLRCLARAFGVRDAAAVAEVGLAVGSDVPFFLGPGPAWATGRGERLRPADVPPLDLVLVYPEDPALAIRAGDAYAWLDAARQGHPVPALGRPARFRLTLLGNDLQAPSVERHPALSTLLGRLVGEGATAAIMSGSGPTVFGVFPGRKLARAAAKTIEATAFQARRSGGPRLQVFPVRTARRQPRATPWRSPRSASSRSARRS